MLSRRYVLKMIGAVGLASTVGQFPGIALAKSHPIGRLQIIAPAAAGSGYDQTARVCENTLLAGKLIDGAQITNIPGAGGTIGLVRFIEQQRGKGDAILVSGSTMMSAVIANKTPVGLEATTPLARLYTTANAIVVPANSPFRNLGDLVAAFHKDASAVSWAGGSVGGGDHIIAGMFSTAIGVDPKKLNYVAFPGGGELLAALLGGHVVMGSSSWNEVAEQIRAGQLRCLGVTSDREEAGIDAPTLRSAGVDVVFQTWRALLAAPGITKEQRNALIAMLDAMVGSSQWQDECKRNDWTPAYLSGDGFSAYIRDQTKQFSATLTHLGLI